MATTPWTDAIHTFDPDETGRCQASWTNDNGRTIRCTSTQRSSVLHDDPESDFREMHSHGGGDCMCFEDENGPSWHEAMRAFVKERGQ